MKIYIYLFILFFYSLAESQTLPADSLLKNNDISIIRKTFIAPITLWQKFSFANSSMNCQFSPSCSQFMAQSIAQHGIISGIIIGSDRIIRCNPMAHYYHTHLDSGNFHIDGRLLDNVPQNLDLNIPNLTIALNIFPGLGRVYKGRTVDGIFSFVLESSLAFSSYSMHKQGHSISAIIFGSASLVFWLSDFYSSLKKDKK